jgi:hypothetical protein
MDCDLARMMTATQIRKPASKKKHNFHAQQGRNNSPGKI